MGQRNPDMQRLVIAAVVAVYVVRGLDWLAPHFVTFMAGSFATNPVGTAIAGVAMMLMAVEVTSYLRWRSFSRL